MRSEGKQMAVEFELQKSLFEVLNAQASTLGITGVYDVAPQAADGGDASAFPYVVIGRTIITQKDTQTRNGWNALVRIHTYSRSGAMQECKLIQGGVYDLLHRQPLTITGASNYLFLRESTDCMADQNSKIHGVCEYLGLIEASA